MFSSFEVLLPKYGVSRVKRVQTGLSTEKNLIFAWGSAEKEGICTRTYTYREIVGMLSFHGHILIK